MLTTHDNMDVGSIIKKYQLEDNSTGRWIVNNRTGYLFHSCIAVCGYRDGTSDVISGFDIYPNSRKVITFQVGNKCPYQSNGLLFYDFGDVTRDYPLTLHEAPVNRCLDFWGWNISYKEEVADFNRVHDAEIEVVPVTDASKFRNE